MLQTTASAHSVPAQNILFIEQFMREESLEVVSQDLGGFVARRVHFYPLTGKAMVKRLGESALQALQLEERQAAQLAQPRPRGDVTLFED